MKILPVLDLLHGVVVRGRAGRRHEYQPLQSPLADSSDAIDVALGFRRHFGFDELYLADLDAIREQTPHFATYEKLRSLGFRLWVDAGIRSASDVPPLLDHGVATVIAGLETLAGPEVLGDLVREVPSDCFVFSLDLKGGQALTANASWPGEPLAIARLAWESGVRRMIVLDLAHVGVDGGVGTEDLCRHLRATYPTLEIIAGGGVRGSEDLQRLGAIGVDAALVASALHDGRLTSEFLPRWCNDAR